MKFKVTFKVLHTPTQAALMQRLRHRSRKLIVKRTQEKEIGQNSRLKNTIRSTKSMHG